MCPSYIHIAIISRNCLYEPDIPLPFPLILMQLCLFLSNVKFYLECISWACTGSVIHPSPSPSCSKARRMIISLAMWRKTTDLCSGTNKPANPPSEDIKNNNNNNLDSQILLTIKRTSSGRGDLNRLTWTKSSH